MPHSTERTYTRCFYTFPCFFLRLINNIAFKTANQSQLKVLHESKRRPIFEVFPFERKYSSFSNLVKGMLSNFGVINENETIKMSEFFGVFGVQNFEEVSKGKSNNHLDSILLQTR